VGAAPVLGLRDDSVAGAEAETKVAGAPRVPHQKQQSPDQQQLQQQQQQGVARYASDQDMLAPLTARKSTVFLSVTNTAPPAHHHSTTGLRSSRSMLSRVAARTVRADASGNGHGSGVPEHGQPPSGGGGGGAGGGGAGAGVNDGTSSAAAAADWGFGVELPRHMRPSVLLRTSSGELQHSASVLSSVSSGVLVPAGYLNSVGSGIPSQNLQLHPSHHSTNNNDSGGISHHHHHHHPRSSTSSRKSVVTYDPDYGTRAGIFLGLATALPRLKPGIQTSIEQFAERGIRFIFFSTSSFKTSKALATKMGMDTGWNSSVSLAAGADSESQQVEGWRDQARMPRGIDEIRKHLADDVDNVPLLVNLFTDCASSSLSLSSSSRSALSSSTSL
jgi:hypothetical protein